MRFKLAVLSLFSLLMIPTGFASDVFVSIGDGVAGQDQDLRVTGLQTNELVNVSLVKPDSTSLDFVIAANDAGVLQDKLFGLHLRNSGDYKLNIVRPSLGETVHDQFAISSGVVSAYRSTVEILERAAPADGETVAELVVTLRDAYDNPVVDESVQLISSRNEDQLTSALITNAVGTAKGSVSADLVGVSVISVLAGDVVLLERPEVIWHPPAENLFAVGQSEEGGLGSFLKAQLFDDDFFADAAYFTISDLPAELVQGRNYTFRVEAKDQDANTSKDYDGRVRFSATDSQAQLPADYQFDDVDQGVHTFALAINFDTPGTQTLTITDIDNSQLTGSVEVNVLSESGGQPASSNEITIVTPSAGTYRSSRVTITGVAPRNSLLRIVDGPTVLVEDLVVDGVGEYVYQTPALADGLHKFIVSSVDGSLSSPEVAIRVDQSPPRVLAVELDPSGGVPANGVFGVSVSSNETLSAASCTFDGLTATLEPAGDRFSTNFQAPGACGEYPMACTVADVLGNELVEPNAAVVRVCVDEPVLEPVPTITVPDEVVAPIAPTAVASLSAQGGEERVTLFWSPATDDTAIMVYQVDYGISAEALINQNITPDNRTQWYVDGLDESTKYYFTVRAIDANGNLGPVGNVVEATTDGEVLRSAAVPTSGSNIWLPLGLALCAGLFFLGVSFRRKR